MHWPRPLQGADFSGVKISEWQPGFTHAKIMIADGVKLWRHHQSGLPQLCHHFENAVWMRGTDCIANMEAIFRIRSPGAAVWVEQTKESIWQWAKAAASGGILLKFVCAAGVKDFSVMAA